MRADRRVIVLQKDYSATLCTIVYSNRIRQENGGKFSVILIFKPFACVRFMLNNNNNTRTFNKYTAAPKCV